MTFATDEPGDSRREEEAKPAIADTADRKPRWYA
ncbi:transcription termination/antitermination protein NusG, partial [Chroococcidiopsidales cyanobacterium LEGE 13417]|nr:transcription termination/antitermination protein NusG [Chroococcidiopsidales cyanobacterium LEGE 13417]